MEKNFLQFCNEMRGYYVQKKNSKEIVHKYILYSKNMTFEMISNKYNLIKRC